MISNVRIINNNFVQLSYIRNNYTTLSEEKKITFIQSFYYNMIHGSEIEEIC